MVNYENRANNIWKSMHKLSAVTGLVGGAIYGLEITTQLELSEIIKATCAFHSPVILGTLHTVRDGFWGNMLGSQIRTEQPINMEYKSAQDDFRSPPRYKHNNPVLKSVINGLIGGAKGFSYGSISPGIGIALGSLAGYSFPQLF